MSTFPTQRVPSPPWLGPPHTSPERGGDAGSKGSKLQTSDTSLGVFDKLTLAYKECQEQLVKYTK